MKVILLKTISNLGQVGDVKNVSDGFARNYLIPSGLVRVATEKTMKELENSKIRKEKESKNKGKKFKILAKKLDNIKIIIKAKADDKKTIFGSVNSQKIAEELLNRGYEVESKYIKLEQPIKVLGYYDIMIDFGSGVMAKIGVTIIREE